MKFIIDAQLPYRLKQWLIGQGLDVIHTLDLPKKQLTSDIEIIHTADRHDRIVITKDSDFFKHNILHQKPKRILMITTGNIINKDLLRLFETNFGSMLNCVGKEKDLYFCVWEIQQKYFQ